MYKTNIVTFKKIMITKASNGVFLDTFVEMNKVKIEQIKNQNIEQKN